MYRCLLFIIFITLTGCLGTIEDPDKVDQSTVSKKAVNFKFEGAKSAQAVSHKGVQVSFKPALNGSGRFDYNLYVDGNFSKSKGSLAYENASPDRDGFIHIISNDLEFRSAPYTLIVRATDRETGDEDSNNIFVTTNVLSDEVPLFNGIYSVTNVQGILGRSALNVKWTPALPARESSNIFDPITDFSISGYTIYYQKNGATSPQSQFIPDPVLTEFMLTGLEENSEYSIWVRAKDMHLTAREDKNLKKIYSSTNPPRPILFEGISSANVPLSQLGLDHIIANWAKADGDFTKYRIFYTTDTGQMVVDPIVNSVQGGANPFDYVDLNVNSSDNANATDLLFPVEESNKTYRVFVVACDDTCANYDSRSIFRSELVTTTPPVAPFAGASSINISIDNVNLVWPYLPDASNGAYDSYKVTMKKAGGAEIELKTSTSPEKILADPSIQSKNVVLSGLDEGVEYCFKVESAITASNGNKTPYSNNSWMCGTPQYIQPATPIFIDQAYLDEFSQPQTRKCHDLTTSGFKLKWKGPATGTFAWYELFIQEGANIDWNATPSKIYLMPTHDADTIYTHIEAGRTPGTVLKVGIRTAYLHSDGNTFYGQQVANFDCETEIQKLVPQEWMSIMAISPKTDGLGANAVIPESMALAGDAYAAKVDMISSVLANDETNRGIASVAQAEFAAPMDYFLLNKNYSGGFMLPAAADNSTKNTVGMVRLAWRDFLYEGGELFSGGSPSSDIGYKIYRLPYQTSHNTTPPTNLTAGWTEVSTGHIQAKLFTPIGKQPFYMVEFVDYIDEADTSVTKDDAQVFWYKVEPYVLTTKMEISGSVASVVQDKDYIVKVVIPPKNMAMIHRWMANKEACERLNKHSVRSADLAQFGIDKNKNYRCKYNGIGSIDYGGTSYLDFRGHILVDRFELGCSFTQIPDSCNKSDGAEICDPNEKNCPEDNGVSDGMCIGFKKPTFQNDGATALLDKTVWYSRKVVESVGAHAFARSQYGASTCYSWDNGAGAWKDLEQVLDETVADFSRAKLMVSNSANLPPINRVSQKNLSKLCGAYDVDLKAPASGTVIKNYTKRLPRKKEVVAAMADPIEISTYSQYYEGDMSSIHNLGCNMKFGWVPSSYNLTNERSNPQTPLANELTHSKANGGIFGQKTNQLNLNHFRYPRATLFEAENTPGVGWYAFYNATINSYIAWEHYPKTGPLFASGSAGEDSTSMCTYRYGIQDIMGNIPEWAGDNFVCPSNSTACYPDDYDEDEDIEGHSYSLNGDVNALADFEIGGNSVGYPFSTYTMDNKDFLRVNPTSANIASSSRYLYYYAYPLYYYNMLGFQQAPYFNPILGLPLECSGSACDDSPDNKLFSTTTYNHWTLESYTDELSSTDIGGDAMRYSGRTPATRIDQSTAVGALNADKFGSVAGKAGVVTGGFPCMVNEYVNYQHSSVYNSYYWAKTKQTCLPPSYNQKNGRYSYDLTPAGFSYVDVGGRCATLIEEDENGNFDI